MSANYMTDHNSFIVYKDWEQYFLMLDDEQAGRLIKALFAYSKRGTDTELEGMTAMAYAFMKNAIERDGKKWEDTVRKNTENGKKGGRPRKNGGPKTSALVCEKTEGFFEKTKKGDTDTDTDKDTDTDTVMETDTDKDTETVTETVMDTETETDTESVRSPQKHYDQNDLVSLTEEEYCRLSSMSSTQQVDKYIFRLSNWLNKHKKHCNSCYDVISKWIAEDKARKSEKPQYYAPSPRDAPSYDMDEFEKFAMNFRLCR